MKPSVINLVRWLLLVPVVVTIFYIFVLLAISIYVGAETFCPEEEMVSGACFANYMDWVKEALLLVTPPLASATMVIGAYLCAPSHKLETAIATFVLGSLAALYYAIESDYWMTFALTEITAGLTVFILWKKRPFNPQSP